MAHGAGIYEGDDKFIDTEEVDVDGQPRHRQRMQMAGSAAHEIVGVEKGRLQVADTFTGGEVLADQGGGGVRTFEFSQPVDLVWVRTQGGNGRIDPFGGTPSSSLGIPAEDELPVPITLTTSSVKVWLPPGATCSVWGFR